MRKKTTDRRPTTGRTRQKDSQPELRRIVSQQTAKKLSDLTAEARTTLETVITDNRLANEDSQDLTVFFSFTDGLKRATVIHFSGNGLREVWQKLARWQQTTYKESPKVRWLRIDWVTEKRAMPWADCLQEIQSIKRNYFRYGIALDPHFRHAFLEQELNANAMLYLGVKHPKAGLNEKNFLSYATKRYGKHCSLPSNPQDLAVLFTTQAILFQPGKKHERLHGYSGGKEGRNTGRRIVETLDPPLVTSLIQQSSQFLAEQVDATGRFIYGLHPCFDREIGAYNTLRHTSTTYAMLEAWEVTQSTELKAAIDRAIKHLTDDLIRPYTLPSGEIVAYLQDVNNEIKLGGSAVCLLALAKYTELTADEQYLPLLEQLALGIQRMQNKESGQLYHVLHANDLSIKEEFRIIYYDGEAAFGLMRLYGLTKDERWLNIVEKAFEYFIENEHWKIHDHWLSYCVNELTLYKPEERYFQFGIQNVVGHLDFVIGRITTYPTLLELMMAAHKMISRLQSSSLYRHLLKQINLEKFYRALEARAQYLLNGFFWPEFAIYFQNPQRIMGSFFIRHHSFRVRIDDVEHYLSGYVAYLQHYLPHPAPKRFTTEHLNTDHTMARQPEPAALPELVHPPAEATLVWGGDVNLGRRQHYRTQQLGFDNVLNIPELKSADLSVVNLECVVSTLGQQGIDKGEGGPYYYRARPEMLNILTAANINAVTVANNHSGDYGPAALMQQQELLRALGIASAGSGNNLSAALAPAICKAGDLRVAIFSVDTTQPRFAATDEKPGAAYLPLREADLWRDTFTPLIAQARQEADLVMIAVHWGENYAKEPDTDEISLGHVLVDAGADAILGASAHCLQGLEIYNNKPIIHDAGDLLFDTVGNSLSDSGIFRLGLNRQGVRWVEFIPVGSGFGYSQRLYGDTAQALIERYQDLCRPFGTVLARHGDSARVELLPAETSCQPKSAPKPPTYSLDALQHFQPTPAHDQVSEVPEDARIAPVEINGLTLLGVRIKPNRIQRRQMLWLETWWTCTQTPSEDLRLSLTAVPLAASKMPEWGRGMDHDPCDWMQPTSRWQPNKIYHDYYGLRPPPMQVLENRTLQLQIRVLGVKQNNALYIHPQNVSVDIPHLPDNPLSRNYHTDFSGIDLQVAQGQTWTAEQLEQITGGHWLVAPPKDWFIRSVVNGTKLVGMRAAPVLFVAHTNNDRSFHEQYSNPPKTLQDRHNSLPDMAENIAGAIVTKPVDGMPAGFPLLQVSDPIRAIMELGFAARQRFTGPVIAVTGTAGKSTTICLLETLFTPGKYIRTLDNYNSRVGAPAQLANLSPDHEAALIEIAQSALWMQRGPITRQIKPNIAVITEIGIAHASHSVKTSADTAKWKSRIFDGLAGDGVAILGEHLMHFDYVLQQAKRHAKRVIVFGTSEKADLQILEKRDLDDGVQLKVQTDRQQVTIDLPFTNMSMVTNALTTLTVAHALEMELSVSAQRMAENYVPDEGRMEEYSLLFDSKKVHIVDDAYNANPLSMKAMLDHISKKKITGKKHLILGDMLELGVNSSFYHQDIVPRIIATEADSLTLLGKEMHKLADELKKTFPKVCCANDHEEARNHLSLVVNEGDMIIAKGSNKFKLSLLLKNLQHA